MRPDDSRLIQAALDAGAVGAMAIPQAQVVLHASFRDICAGNACGKFGRYYTCPPDVGEIEALMAAVRAYPRALVYQTIAPLEDSFDFEGMEAAGISHAAVCQRVHDTLAAALPPPFLHLAGGGCRLCETCAKQENIPCRYPERMLPSISSHGIDVYSTLKGSSLKYINGQNTVTYFGMAFFSPEEA